MVSSSLNALRGTPAKQAQLFNDFLPASGKIRLQFNWQYGQPKIQQLAQTASDSLQSMLEDATKAEQKIRGAVKPSDEASEAGCYQARYAMIDKGLDLHRYCQVLLSNADRDGFAGLRSEMALIVAATTSQDVQIDRAKKDALDTIAQFERQLFTTDEQNLLDEVRECDISIGYVVRNAKGLDNFSVLQKYFTAMRLNGYQGSIVKPVRIFNWLGLPGSPSSNIPYLRLAGSDDPANVGQPNTLPV